MKKAMLLTLAALTLLAPVALAVDDEWGVITIPKGQPIHVGFSAALTGDYANLCFSLRTNFIANHPNRWLLCGNLRN